MLKVDHAVLHVFDLDTGSCILSEHELDLSERQPRSYVQRMMRKATNSPDNNTAKLDTASNLGSELLRYAQGLQTLVDLSQDIARELWEPLRMSEEATPCDLLVADFTDTEAAHATLGTKIDVDDDVPWDDEKEEDRSRRFLGIMLLPRKRAFVHQLMDRDGASASGLSTNDSALPNPTQKLSHYMVVDMDNLEVGIVDEKIQLAGNPCYLLSQTLLCCTPAPSPRKVVDTVVRIAGDIAEQYGEPAALVMADAKDYVTHRAQQDSAITPQELGEQVFADKPELASRFAAAVQEEALPEEVHLRASAANRLAKSHRIRTDTGIDITFPSAYASDQHYIEFAQDREGGIQITIHAAHIENR